MSICLRQVLVSVKVLSGIEWYLSVCFRLSEVAFCVLHFLKEDSCVFRTMEEGLTVFLSLEGL
jgi:hypothetical protein